MYRTWVILLLSLFVLFNKTPETLYQRLLIQILAAETGLHFKDVEEEM